MSGPVVAAYKGDAGPDVLAFARRWAAGTGQSIEVVTVYPGTAPIGRGRVDSEWVAYNREEAERILDGARAALDGSDARFRAVPAESAPRGLHDVLERAGSDAFAVLGSKDGRGARRTGTGSTAERLLTGASGPVVLVPWAYDESPDEGIHRLVVAYVDTPDGRRALAVARSTAHRLRAALELVSVLPDTRVTPAMGEPTAFAAGQRQAFQSALSAAAAEGEATRVLEGPVVDALADLRPEDCDLLVVGSRGYGPVGRVLLGGVSARLLRQARVPVMVVPRP